MNLENERSRTVLNVLSDGLLILLSLVLAYGIRFGVFQGEPDHMPLDRYVAAGLLIAPFFLVIYGLRGLYENRNQRFLVRLEGLVQCNLVGTLVLIAVLFAVKSIDISRWTLAIFFVVVTLLVGGKWYLLHRIRKARRQRGLGLKRVLLVGSGDAAELYVSAIRADPTLGYTILGCVTDGEPPAGVRFLGSLWDFGPLLEELNPDLAVAALSLRETSAVGDVIDECEKAGVKLSLVPFYARHLPSRPVVDAVGNVPLMNLRRIPLDNLVNAFCKRVGDLIGAAVLILLFSPVMLVAAVGTKLSSPGPVIFRQVRVGRNKKPFTMLKFRSMRLNDGSDTAWTTPDDARKTRFGYLMRKLSIDELPQLFNVLKGDMSLVGPRPELPHFVEQFRESVPLYMVKHQVRPGMTGWAQVNGLRGDTSIPDRIRHDIWYIENWSMLLDVKILLMTLTRFVNPEVRPDPQAGKPGKGR